MKAKTPKAASSRKRPASKRKAPKAGKGAADSRPAGSPEHWNLRLYVAGQTPRSLTAFANLKKICEQHLAGRYHIEVIDLLKQPQLAQGDQIVAIPTLVRKLPAPIKRIVGDLSNSDRVLVGMDLEEIGKLESR